MSKTPTQHAWIFVAVTPTGIHWPGRGIGVDSQHFARIPGRWLSERRFQTTDGDVLLVPEADEDGTRDGPVVWLEPSENVQQEQDAADTLVDATTTT
jgi:hypothetical protein